MKQHTSLKEITWSKDGGKDTPVAFEDFTKRIRTIQDPKKAAEVWRNNKQWSKKLL